jgi:hypothetical protein
MRGRQAHHADAGNGRSTEKRDEEKTGREGTSLNLDDEEEDELGSKLLKFRSTGAWLKMRCLVSNQDEFCTLHLNISD